MLLPDLLALSVVTERFSRIRTPGNTLQRHFNMQLGGSAVKQVQGRQYTIDIMDYRRTVADGRAPGVGPSFVAPQPVGRLPVTLCRTYEALRLDYEKLLQIRTLGKNAGVQDRMGVEYLDAQLTEMKRRQTNFREVMTAGVLRGSFDIQFAGEDRWVPVFDRSTNPGFTIDFQMPAGNKTQLNMLGAGSIIDATWATAGTKILTHLMNINAAFLNLVGEPLKYVAIPSAIWANVIANTQVINAGGSANTPFAQWEMTGDKAPDGSRTGVQRAILRGIPWVEWIIYDGVLTLNGTDTALLEANTAKFMIEPDASWMAMVEGSEIVAENPWSTPTERYGTVCWLRPDDRPACVELHSLQNAIAELKLPKAIANGTVVF